MNDAFDDLLNMLADVQIRKQDTSDSYGVANPQFITVTPAVPCFVTGFGRRTGQESRANTKFAIGFRMVMMRPYPNGEGTLNQLSNNNWLLINGEEHNIVSIVDPGDQRHHIEIETRVVFV